MSFFAVLLALLIEQLRPLPRGNWVFRALVGWMRWTGLNFNAGRDRHAWVVWGVTVVLPAVVAFGVYFAIARFSLILALAWNVCVLYLTLGFRQFSHYFTDIRDALEQGDDETARQRLADWRHLDASELPRTELLRHVLEHSLLAAHRHVFGVFFWFVLLSAFGLGPAGAVLYRMSEFASRYWAYKSRTVGAPTNDRLMLLSRQLFSLVDHVPARMTAFGFAVVGNPSVRGCHPSPSIRTADNGVSAARADRARSDKVRRRFLIWPPPAATASAASRARSRRRACRCALPRPSRTCDRTS